MTEIQRLLSLKQIKEIIPYSTMQIYRLEKAGAFPRRIKIGRQRVAWVEADIRKWVETKIAGEKNGTV